MYRGARSIDDIVLIEKKSGISFGHQRLNERTLALERKGLRNSRNKTEYTQYEFEKGKQVVYVTKK